MKQAANIRPHCAHIYVPAQAGNKLSSGIMFQLQHWTGQDEDFMNCGRGTLMACLKVVAMRSFTERFFLCLKHDGKEGPHQYTFRVRQPAEGGVANGYRQIRILAHR